MTTARCTCRLTPTPGRTWRRHRLSSRNTTSSRPGQRSAQSIFSCYRYHIHWQWLVRIGTLMGNFPVIQVDEEARHQVVYNLDLYVFLRVCKVNLDTGMFCKHSSVVGGISVQSEFVIIMLLTKFLIILKYIYFV